MENILRSISFSITQKAYPMISYLYNIFELIANNQYFSSETIETLSGNIYIVISVCMLFTLGLKLLTAIVNPEVLTDSGGGSSSKGSKRTAKNVFFSILFSVFLIILIPIGFKYLYRIQSDILERQVVEKIVLGADTTEDHAPGQILASYAFASFCQPNETVSVESIANDGGNLYNLAITQDIGNIKKMDGVINSKTNGEYDLNYNWILSPAVGVFLAYEMVLTCIDIALRSIKLALLELITAVVLCAYIVSGTDILKRWAQEVFKTYINVFLKVAAMSFMVFGLSRLEEFLDSLNFDSSEAGFWSRGLLRVFIIIGLLQMVKQIPNFINTIFGTNIQARGGIRGRLGEMAAVGQIAQQGWDKVRNAAGKVGMAGLKAGALFASGPVGWAAAGAAVAGGAALKHGWNKGFGGKTPWKDTSGGRVLRHVGGGAKGIWTGLSAKKGLFGSISEGVKAYQDTDVAKSAAGAKEYSKMDKIIGGIKGKFGIGADGRVSNVVNAENNHAAEISAGLKSADQVRTEEAREAQKNANNNINGTLNQYGAGKYKEAVNKVTNANADKELADAAKTAYNNICDKATAAMNALTDDDERENINIMLGKFKKGDITAEALQATVNMYNEGAAGDIGVDVGNLKNVLGSTLSDGTTLSTKLKISSDGKGKITDINNEAAALETIYNTAKSDLDSAMEKGHATDIQKAVINKVVEYTEKANKTVADTQKKWNE